MRQIIQISFMALAMVGVMQAHGATPKEYQEEARGFLASLKRGELLPNLETKRRALEQVDPSTKPGRPPRWRRDPELMTWLDSL